MVTYHDIDYPPAGEKRRLHVYLPPGYPQRTGRCPVMYMFDGHNLFHDWEATYGTSWGLEGFLDRWAKPLIVVGMECSHHGDDRLREYCPYDTTVVGHRIHGIGEQTFRWIIDDVKPYVDATYLTWGHREATAIGGSSMGGIMSLYGVMAHNDVFSKAACVSTGVGWQLRHFERTLAQSAIDPDTRVYLSWGEAEGGGVPRGANPATDSREARAERRMEALLGERGARTRLYCQPGGRHCEADWARQDALFLDWLWLEG